ncbi:MAG TPA: hypothetical protein VN426_09270 [Syntrophomonadaceae bacterium]|nr:hypothetical protein [Syntrophomonadaceae bacterium]
MHPVTPRKTSFSSVVSLFLTRFTRRSRGSKKDQPPDYRAAAWKGTVLLHTKGMEQDRPFPRSPLFTK